jgi:hypothetical protein
MVNGSYSIKSIIYNDLGLELQRLIKVSLILKIHCNSLSFILPIKQEVDLLTRVFTSERIPHLKLEQILLNV